MRKSPYISRLLPLHQWKKLPFSTDEEAAASKRMVIYAFSAQINLFTSFFVNQLLRNTVFILSDNKLCDNKLSDNNLASELVGNKSFSNQFKVDRLQMIVVAKNLSVLQLFSSRMPKMCAILQLVSAPLNHR